jgi:hypothetical protein
MAHRAVRLTGAAIGVIAGSFALSAPAAFAKGPPPGKGAAPKVSASASPSCLVTVTASWNNQTVTSIIWTLYENGNATAFPVHSIGGPVQPSPQSTTWQLPASTKSNSFFVTAELKNGATQVGALGTSTTFNANCG